jgi:hypothetical protein
MTIKANQILPGHKGELLNDKGDLLAQIPSYQAQVNINNQDYQPAGSPLSIAVMMGYSVSLQFTETVVSDVTLLKDFVDRLKRGEALSLKFQGKITGYNGEEERIVYGECVPDGTIDLQNIQPGDIISRAWNWRVNKAPDLQKYLGDFVGPTR